MFIFAIGNGSLLELRIAKQRQTFVRVENGQVHGLPLFTQTSWRAADDDSLRRQTSAMEFTARLSHLSRNPAEQKCCSDPPEIEIRKPQVTQVDYSDKWQRGFKEIAASFD